MITMTASTFIITLLHGESRHDRHIIAHNTMQAMRIGIRMLPKTDEPRVIICKPAKEHRYGNHS